MRLQLARSCAFSKVYRALIHPRDSGAAMHRRYQSINIPTEIVRTIVAISETGSYTRAGERLNLSQPAITSQVKRLQVLAGGAIFERTPFGVAPTARGEIVIAQARKLLEANDQILSIGGAVKDARAVRIGVSNLYAEQLVDDLAAAPQLRDHASFCCDRSEELVRLLSENYVDVALMLSPQESRARIVARWNQDFVWVRARGFVLAPGAPLPIVGQIGCAALTHAIEALEAAGLTFRTAFASSSFTACTQAVGASIGIMAVPRQCVPDSLVVANEYYLPKLAPMTVGVCTRLESERLPLAPVIKVFEAYMAKAAERVAREWSAAAAASARAGGS